MTHKRDFNLLCGFFALVLAMGGAGLSFPLLEMTLELAAIGVLAYLALTPRLWRFNRLTRLSLLLLGLTLLLPLLQLVPLPPGVWHALPGRQVPIDLDALLGSTPWRPLTLDVEGTIRSFLRLLPATATFLACLFLPGADRARLTWVVLGFAMLNALLGVIQLATNGGFTPYPSGHIGFPIGLFVNRNHNAAFILASMPLLAAVTAAALLRGKRKPPILVGAVSTLLILVVVVLGTTSRAGFGLLPLAIAAFLFILFRRRAPFQMVLPSVGAIAALLLFLFVSGGFTRTLTRFSSLNDLRFGYWEDITWALHNYGLAGTGFGTFEPVYMSSESLAVITPAIVNHAHNDYLEILLEGGLVGAGILVLFLALAGTTLFVVSKSRPSGERSLYRTAAAMALALLLLASAVDYPVRMPAVSATFALLFAVLLPTKSDAPNGSGQALAIAGRGDGRRWLRRAPWLVPLAILAAVVLQAGVSARAILDGRDSAAERWAWWSTRAHEDLAGDALLHGRPAEAASEAKLALGLSPISAPAIRTIGFVNVVQGSAARGNALMQIAASLSWRDQLTQLWAIDAAERSGESAKALQRAEALFLQEALVGPAIAQLLRAPPQDRIPSMLAQELAQSPSWRSSFFDNIAKLPPTDTAAAEQIIAMLRNSKAPATAAEVQPLLDTLAERRDIAGAQRITSLVHGDTLITNGGFEEFDPTRHPPFPEDWSSARNTHAFITAAPTVANPRNHALEIAGSAGSPVLSQQIIHRPGTYRLTYEVRLRGGAAAALEWKLSCRETRAKDLHQVAVPATRSWSRSSLSINVPDQDCPIQKLALTRLRATNEQQIWLDNLELKATGH
jgi:O-antigen ligase